MRAHRPADDRATQASPQAPAGLGDTASVPCADRYAEVRALVIGAGSASSSFIQRTLYMGWKDAKQYVERLEAEGFVSPLDECGRRRVLKHNLRGEA